MKTAGNIVWLLFGGAVTGVEYILAGVAMMITIVGIPFGLQCIKLGLFCFWPFGSKIVTTEDSLGGCLNTALNIIWILIGGFWIALTHLALGALLCLTIICIPFGRQHFKLIKLALFPFGKEVMPA